MPIFVNVSDGSQPVTHEDVARHCATTGATWMAEAVRQWREDAREQQRGMAALRELINQLERRLRQYEPERPCCEPASYKPGPMSDG